MVATPPVPAEVARWVLSHETTVHDSPAALLAAAARAHLRLRANLSIFFGQTGFDSLWARAVSLAQLTIADETGTGGVAHLLRVEGWPVAVYGRTANETRDVVLAVLTSFIALLFTFVGSEVGTRLISQVWPEPPLDSPGTPTGAATA